MINLQDPSMLAAARSQVKSLRWRLAVAALFAVGSALVLESPAAGFGWYLVLVLSMCFDNMLGNSYLEQRGEADRRTAGVLFVWGTFFSTAICAAMPVALAAVGGGPGRVLGVLIAASSLVSVMMFAFQAQRFMYLAAVPPTIALMAMPFIPFDPSALHATQGALGVGCGVIGLLAYLTRSALNNGNMVAGWRKAHQSAKERQLEAEVKRAEAEEANRVKSEFLAVMTHELRTPLNAVIGYAEIIQEDLDADGRKDLAGDAGRISGSARHLLGLIDQILNLSSMDAGVDGVQARDVDVRKLIEEAIHAVQDDAREAGNRISMRVTPEAERAYTDGGKLAVCLSSLMSNAVKFTANGLIAVTADYEHTDHEVLVLSVSDTGVGIADEDMPKLFKAFTQIDATATREKGGMGLGLSIAQRMARTLGGEVTATSERGVGSTFVVRVPLKLLAHAPEARAAA
ncbi:MAG: HAMP domain-containing sensor histidine kinase [Hyphomonadaceae bacterium]